MFDEDIDAEKKEAFEEFTKEYGKREEDWCIYNDDWHDWDDLFCEIKTYWKTKAVRHWREKILKRFVYSLPGVRNPTSLFHVLLQFDAIYLPQILSLIELPYYPLELREEIWPNGIDTDEIKVGNNTNEVDKFRCGLLLQDKDSIADYYTKIKRCNNIVNLCKSHLEGVFFDGLSTENKKYFAKSGFYHIHDLDKVVEMLIQAEKENVPDFITAFSDYLRQASNVQISTQFNNNFISAFLNLELTRPSMAGWYNTNLTSPSGDHFTRKKNLLSHRLCDKSKWITRQVVRQP
jgi:hypothetical protein